MRFKTNLLGERVLCEGKEATVRIVYADAASVRTVVQHADGTLDDVPLHRIVVAPPLKRLAVTAAASESAPQSPGVAWVCKNCRMHVPAESLTCQNCGYVWCCDPMPRRMPNAL